MADEVVDKATWIVELPNDSREWRERVSGGFQTVKTESAPAPLEHSHPTHGDINLTGTVSAGGKAGITGSKTIGGFKFTFTNGLLTGFEPV